MQLLYTAVLSNECYQALCWTLIHSLWQGLIASVIAAVVVTLTKKSSAALRYNLLVTILLLFVIAAIVTACMQFQFKTPATGISTINAGIAQTPTIGFIKNEPTVSEKAIGQNLAVQLTQYCNQHAAVIVAIWFLLFLIKCSQLLAGMNYLHRLRHRNNHNVSHQWKGRLLQLAQKTGIRASILFLESEVVKVPAVIGFLKPVLLVPVGLLSNLPPDQVEAILLHELAHIRRRDFLVNLLQSIIETFFFFNPAIVWISSLIREEREACCDDMVIAGLPQKGSYLQALVSFQELHIETHAMALTGKKNYLLNRVKRMLTQENKKLNLMEKTALLLGIIGITAFSFITKEKKENPAPAPVKEIIKQGVKETPATNKTIVLKKPLAKNKKMARLFLPETVTDTVPKTLSKPTVDGETKFPTISSSTNNDGNTVVSSIEATDNTGRQYKIKRIDGKMTELLVDGKTIPQDQYSDYDEVIRSIDETQRKNTIKRKEKLELVKAETVTRRKELAEKKSLLEKQDRKELVEKKNLLAKQDMKERTEKRKLMSDSLRLGNDKRVEERKKLIEQKNELRKIELDKKEGLRIQKQQLLNVKRSDDVTRIIADLNNQNLISDTDNLSFNLSSNELVVNGKKQPAEVHQQFKEKYIQKNGDRFSYAKKGGSTSITIVKD